MKAKYTSRLGIIAAALLSSMSYHGPAEVKSVLTTDAEGNEFEAPIDEYIKGIIEQFGVKDIESETQGKIPAKKAIKYFVNTLFEEKDLDPSLSEISEVAEALNKIKEDVQRTKANAKSAADKAKEEKEAKEKAKAEEKARKEQEAKELAVKQEGFVAKVNEGYDKALDEFKGELENLKEGLPTTISIGVTGAGAGAVLSDSATVDDIATGIGYLFGKAEGSKMLGQQLQFIVGDLAGAAIEKGIYPDSVTASKAISADLEKNGKRLAPNSIDVYRRLALRTPIEVRNPTVDPSAFLAITQVNPNPKKMDGETDEAFNARKEKLASDLRALQEELKEGKIKTRKEILPKVLEVEYNNNLKERPSADKAPSPTQNLINYFLSSLALESLDGIHEEGEIHFLGEDGKSIVQVKTEDIEKLKEEAYNNLLNIYVKTKKVEAKDILRGYVIETKNVPVGTDGDGKAITEPQQIKTNVYLRAFFPIDSEEAEGQTEEQQEPAADSKPAAKKAAKKAAKTA